MRYWYVHAACCLLLALASCASCDSEEPTCSDGVRNGGESDIDCGGSCGRCADGKACAAAADCSSNTCQAGTCVTLLPAPTIASFTAAVSTVTAGSGTTLTAVFSNGTGVIDHDIGAVASGAAVPTGDLTATTTFTLTVTNAAGASVTATTTVAVVAAPAISSFTAAASTVTVGSATTLTAVFNGGTGVVDQGVGTIVSGVAMATATLDATTTFTLTVTNVAGASVTATTTVTAVAAPAISSFTAAALTLTTGSATNLTAVFSGGTGNIDHGLGAATSGVAVATGALTATTTFTLTVTNAAGDSTTATATVSVVAAPAIQSFAAASATITHGTSTLLSASFSNGSGTIDHGVAAVTSGVAVATGALTETTTFTLTVVNAAGTSVTATAVVTVIDASAIQSFSADSPTVLHGTGTLLRAVFSGGSGVVEPGAIGVESGVPLATGALTAEATYTLTVTNAVGAAVTASTTVAVAPRPAIVSFDAAVASLRAGDSTLLTAVFSDGSGTVDHGVGPVSSGVAVSTGALAESTTFTLTVTGFADAQVTATAQVVVETCHDDQQNGGETDVDCGGPCLPCLRDCGELHQALPALASGIYAVDPDGAAGAAAFKVACDMETAGGGWTLVAREVMGAVEHLRYLGIDSGNPGAIAAGSESGLIGVRFGGAYNQVRLVWGSDDLRFTLDPGFDLFGNTVSTHLPVVEFATSNATLDGWVNAAGGAVLCVASRHDDVRPGDTSWAIKPADDLNEGCGCNSGDWTGRGAYYGGAPSDSTVCTAWGGGWAGVRDSGVQKGGIVPGYETQIWIRLLLPTSCADLKRARPAAGDGVYQIDPDQRGPLPALDAYCDMTTEGGGWTMCYTERDDMVHLQTELSSTVAHGSPGYRVDCRHIPFSSVLYVNEESSDKAWFTRQSAGTVTIAGLGYAASGDLAGLWDAHGVATSVNPYQLNVCDSGWMWVALMMTGYDGCWKQCHDWCSDTSTAYFRTYGDDYRYGVNYSGVAFNENGHGNVGYKTISVGIR